MENENEITKCVKLLKAGDKESFEKLYGYFYKDMYRYSLYSLNNEEDAKDCVMETFYYAYAGIGRLKNEEAFKAWLFKILTNRIKKIKKGYVKEKGNIAFSSFDEEKGDIFNDPFRDYDIRDAFMHLKKEDRMIISLHILLGFKSKEIGEMLNMKDSTVRSRERRALSSLRMELYGED